MDIVDILLQAGIFLTFVIFAVAVFSIKRDVIRKRRKKDDRLDEVD